MNWNAYQNVTVETDCIVCRGKYKNNNRQETAFTGL